jgi:hypothetical protein
MATIDKYKLEIDVVGQQSVDKLKNSLGGIGTAIAGIGISAFVHGIIEMSDAMSDLADATGLAIGDIVAFNGAIEQAGGKSENASKMLAAFFQNIDKAAQGGESAQKSLAKVGITMNDLANLSEKDLLARTLNGLKEMGPGAERTALGMELLGKSFRSIDPKKLEEAFASGDFSRIQEDIQKLGDLADKMSANFRTMQLAGASIFSGILSSLEPFIGKIEEGRLSLDQAESAIKKVGLVLAIVFGAKTVVLIGEVVTALIGLNAALAGTAAVSALLGKNPLVKLIAGAAIAAGVGAAAWNEYEKAVADAGKAQDTVSGTTPAGAPAGPKRKTQLLSDEELKAQHQALIAAKQITEQQTLQNAEAQKYQRTLISTIGMNQDQANEIRTNAQLEQDANNKILDLNKQIEIEKGKGRTTNQGVIQELEKQKEQVNSNLAITKELKKEELDRLAIIKNQLTNLSAVYDNLTYGFDSLTKSQENSIQKQIINGKMTEEQGKRHLELENLAGQSFLKTEALRKQSIEANLQGDSRAAQLIENKMNLEEEYYQTMRRNIIEAQKLEDEKRQSSTAGAKAALEQISRSMDPFTLAQNRVNAMFSSMSSAIDKFVETGKFSFSDFARSVIQDLIKIELKAQATQLMKGVMGAVGGGGGLFGGAIIPGFLAGGGDANAGKPYVVGENGPELFVPKSAGTVVPNGQTAASGGTTNVTYNISAIDSKSVAQFFAENRRTMLGTMQMAQKELPYGNR